MSSGRSTTARPAVFRTHRERGHRVAEAAKLSLQDRVGVPGNQTHDALWGIDARETAGTVERVKPVFARSGAYPMSWSHAARSATVPFCGGPPGVTSRAG